MEPIVDQKGCTIDIIRTHRSRNLGAIETLSADVLVLGGGMAGMSAAASAACAGARAVVLERAPDIGGSAVLSGGNLQTTPTLAGWKQANPLGDPALGELVVGGFPEAIEWMRSLDVELGPEGLWLTTYMHMRGYRMDILGYIRRAAAVVSSSGHVATGATVRSLIRENGCVTGARVVSEDGEIDVIAPWTVIATGGFPADRELRQRYINRNADDILVRSHPYNTGAGIRLGQAAGAAVTERSDGFYGHLMCAPLKDPAPTTFGRLSQYQSSLGVIVNVFGERFTDESLGDIYNNQALVRQPGRRGVLVVDERIRRTYMTVSHAVGMACIDRFAEAARAGAHYVRAGSLDEVATAIGEWGFDSDAFLRTMAVYNSGTLMPSDPLRREHHEPMLEAPFHAVEVQPSITFTHAGLRIDDHARVLGGDGKPIGGLLAAGSDAGGVYQKGYCGGLAAALVTGRRAAKTALASLS